MESFREYVKELIETDDPRIAPRHPLYGRIVKLRAEEIDKEKFEDVIRMVHVLINTGKIQKDILFISLLLNKPILDLFLRYERTITKLRIDKPISVLNYTYFNNNHWFHELIANLDDHLEVFPEEIKGILNILKIISLTHSKLTNLDDLGKHLSTEFTSNDKLLSAYIANVKQRYDTIKYISSSEPDIHESDLYMLSNHMNFLETFSHFMDLKNLNNWPEILNRLEENQKFSRKYYRQDKNNIDELDVFISYTVLLNVIYSMNEVKTIKCERKCKEETNSLIEMCKTKVLHVKNRMLQLELLEDVFTLIFARTEHLTTTGEFGEFYCTDLVIKLLITFLKNILEDLKKTYNDNKSQEYSRFSDLQKLVTDASWRFQLISDLRSHKYDPKSFLKLMLSRPETLINLCLNRDDIDRANQVIQVFNLQKSYLAFEINYSRDMAIFKRDITNVDKQNLPLEEAFMKLQNAIEHHKKLCGKKFEDMLNSHVPTTSLQTPTLDVLEYQLDVDILDIIVSLPIKYTTFKYLVTQLHDNFTSTLPALSKYYYRTQDVTEDTFIPADKLYSHYSTYDSRKYHNTNKQSKKLIDTYDDFTQALKLSMEGSLNLEHNLHEKLLKIQDICIAFGSDDKKEYTHFIEKLLKYLQGFAKILYSQSDNSDLISNGKDVSVLEILNHRKPDVVCNLLYKRNIDGADFDNLFCKLKLDLTYHITYFSFPHVTFDLYGNIETSHNLTLQKPRQDVINYVQKRAWFLAYLINRIHGVLDPKIERNEVRIKFFTNLINLPDIQRLKKLFDGNETLTILHQDYCFFLKNYFDNLMLADDASTCFEEGYMKLKLPPETTWKSLYELALTIPEKDLKAHNDIFNLRDILLCNLIKERKEENYYEYARYISDHELRMRIITDELQYWPGEFCVNVLKAEISNCEDQCDIEKLMLRYKQVELYMEVKQLCDYSSWFEVDELCTNTPEIVMLAILETTDLDVLLHFFYLHPPHEELLHNITEYHLLAYFEKYTFYDIQKLLNVLPKKHCIVICVKLFSLLRSLTNLNFVVNYLLNINEFDASLKNIQVSSRILQSFPKDEVDQMWCLLEDPLSMFEILLMNTRLEKFGEIYNRILPELENVEADDRVISVEKIDELLRTYAEKSLEFKVVGYCQPSGSVESKLMQSIDTIYLEPVQFVMPDKVPDKSEWTPDNEVVECMCCRHTRFSMFNRRHHCRRCGRVICWGCSSKRMAVDKYGDVLVRVCRDCFNQTRSKCGSTGNFRSITDEYWLLLGEPEHDNLVRQEFTYENAPSVMLSLMIMKHHSKNDEHPKFLLQQCENILKILRPHADNRSQEIDYNLIIKMLKALAVAAKVMAHESVMPSASTMVDEILSQAEMLGLLAENHYLHLLPPPSRFQSAHVDANVLRTVRDKLLEQEQWSLALEISTKAGLDATGVFAMWGKSFLHAGNLQAARHKFQICFDKIGRHGNSELASFHQEHAQPSTHRGSLYRGWSPDSKATMTKDPPLLTEIVQILESKIDRINPKFYQGLSSLKTLCASTTSLCGFVNMPTDAEDAICILNNLDCLDAIENGTYNPREVSPGYGHQFITPHMENVFFEECIYYLNKYGNHVSLCQFLVRHHDLHEALIFIDKKKLSPDVFIELYLNCLREGEIALFHDAMVEIDPTFNTWMDYIKSLCVFMDKQSMLHCLYQLQLLTGDYIRAALTCLKFYTLAVSTFSELSTKNQYLYTAQSHMRQILDQEQWVDVSTVRISSCSFLEEKPIANPALVMTMDRKSLKLHIHTINKQIDVVNYLAAQEENGQQVTSYIRHITSTYDEEANTESCELPTLFGSTLEKIQLAVLMIVSSTDIFLGFKHAYEIIQEFNLKPLRVFCHAGKVLALNRQVAEITDLYTCVLKCGVPERTAVDMCDDMLTVTAVTLAKAGGSDAELEDVIKYINNPNKKVDTYVDTKQLRSGFVLAAKHLKSYDIIRIRREAKYTNRADVLKLCEKYFETHQEPDFLGEECKH